MGMAMIAFAQKVVTYPQTDVDMDKDYVHV
jgi:hypothetical protein